MNANVRWTELDTDNEKLRYFINKLQKRYVFESGEINIERVKTDARNQYSLVTISSNKPYIQGMRVIEVYKKPVHKVVDMNKCVLVLDKPYKDAVCLLPIIKEKLGLHLNPYDIVNVPIIDDGELQIPMSTSNIFFNDVLTVFIKYSRDIKSLTDDDICINIPSIPNRYDVGDILGSYITLENASCDLNRLPLGLIEYDLKVKLSGQDFIWESCKNRPFGLHSLYKSIITFNGPSENLCSYDISNTRLLILSSSSNCLKYTGELVIRY